MRARSSMHLQAMFAMGLAAFLWGTPPQKPTPKDSRRPVPQGVVSEDADMAGVGSCGAAGRRRRNRRAAACC